MIGQNKRLLRKCPITPERLKISGITCTNVWHIFESLDQTPKAIRLVPSDLERGEAIIKYIFIRSSYN
jgi:hypothetical protein